MTGTPGFDYVALSVSSQQLTTMADCLFGKDSENGTAWARRMRKLVIV